MRACALSLNIFIAQAASTAPAAHLRLPQYEALYYRHTAWPQLLQSRLLVLPEQAIHTA